MQNYSSNTNMKYLKDTNTIISTKLRFSGSTYVRYIGKLWQSWIHISCKECILN